MQDREGVPPPNPAVWNLLYQKYYWFDSNGLVPSIRSSSDAHLCAIGAARARHYSLEGRDCTQPTSQEEAHMKFVLVTGRSPRPESFCALCCEPIGEGYLRELTTRLSYCNYKCYLDHCKLASSGLKKRARAS
jgi:hypothetical protein